MASLKRPRACNACHSIKIKCELGSEGGQPPCARCKRLGKDCFITIPPRQKDRVATLEAQVEALTRLLQASNISPPADIGLNLSGDDAPGQRIISASKKRRLEDGSERQSTSTPPSEIEVDQYWTEMDAIVSPEEQHNYLNQYMAQYASSFELLNLETDWQFEKMRERRPLLLQAIINTCSHGCMPVEQQEEIAKIVFSNFSPESIARRAPTIDLIQALLLSALWYRKPRFHAALAIPHLIELATENARALGYAESPKVLASSMTDSAIHWRAWLLCYHLSASYATNFRIPDVLPWTPHEDKTLLGLEHNIHGCMKDRLFGQFIRAMRLTEHITNKMRLYEPMAKEDEACRIPPQYLADKITDWKAQVPLHLYTPTLEFWEHIAIITLYERMLHTPTNAETFGAPYVAERLSATEFPAPVIKAEHMTALPALRDALHKALDIFLNLDIPTIMALPTMLFAARVAYCSYMLLKLYTASTAPGNTYGLVIDPESIRIDEYQGKLMDLHDNLREIEGLSNFATGMMLSATGRLREWLYSYRCYRSMQVSQPAVSAPVISVGLATDFSGLTSNGVSEAGFFGLGTDSWELGFGNLFNDAAAGQGYVFPSQSSLDGMGQTSNGYYAAADGIGVRAGII